MCGIAVAIDWPEAEATVETLIAGILHRGDVTDPLLRLSSTTALCTRRLRIVDAEGAVQPQSSADGRIVVSFNGEIYNHKALRNELNALGIVFRTQSDTEVLANALQVWGQAAVPRLIGMFAFVAVDLQANQFLAARDPFGEKPLYLIQSRDGFLFCSEIRPLLHASETGDVLLLPPGYLLTRSACRRFAALPAPSALKTSSSARDLDCLLSDAVERCAPPDLPFATFFSGGIDSTLIAHYARRISPTAPAYFVGDADAPDHHFAAAYADQTGLDLRTLPLSAYGAEMLQDIDDVLMAVESFEPSVVRPSLCYQALSRRVHEDGFRVVLTGEGADELFCGYRPLELTYAEGDALGAPVRDQCLALLNRSALQRTDRTTMRSQIEARSPFLDRTVVEHAFSLGSQALLRSHRGALQGKAPLRAIYDLYPEALPAIIRDRTKLPLNEGAGLDVSQRDSHLKRLIEETISDEEFRRGKLRYRDYSLETKEELYYLNKLNTFMDISRVPHLKGRLTLEVPNIERSDELKAYMA